MRYLCSEKYVGSQVLLNSVGLRLLHMLLIMPVELPGQGKACYFRYPFIFRAKPPLMLSILRGHHKLTIIISTELTPSILYLMSMHGNQKKVQEAKLALPVQKIKFCLVLLSKLLLHQG